MPKKHMGSQAKHEIHQCDDKDESSNDNEEIISKKSEMILDDGWRKVSRHENTRKQTAKNSDDNEKD